MTTEYTDITIPVPSNRVAEFYRMVGEWLEGRSTPAAGTTVKGWRDGAVWTAADITDAQSFYRSLSENARRILSTWARRPGEWMTGEETAEAVGVNGPRGVAGSLSSVGKSADKMGRALPFEHEAGTNGEYGKYRMTPVIAELFVTAAEAVER